MSVNEIMRERHSVRQYSAAAIEPEKQSALADLAASLNKEYGLNMQILFDEPTCFDSMMAHYGKFTGVKNYIALVGKKTPDLSEKLGYCGEQLVLKAQELGLNTCWVAMTHGKSKAKIGRNEKQVCLIALGYGSTNGVEHTSKNAEELSNLSQSSPQWFKDGVTAAMLAPTAMNQQKFHIEYLGDDRVKMTCGKGFYTKLDFGIVKYHFVLAADKDIKFC